MPTPAFPDLRKLKQETNRDTLDLPIGGKTYTFTASIPIDTGIRIARMQEESLRFARAMEKGEAADFSMELLDDVEETKLYLDLIGEKNLAEMKADGVSWPECKQVALTLLAWHMVGANAALASWGVEEANPNPPARRSSSKTRTTSRSSSTTSSPRASKATKPRRSGGETSSKRGR